MGLFHFEHARFNAITGTGENMMSLGHAETPQELLDYHQMFHKELMLMAGYPSRSQSPTNQGPPKTQECNI